jgi:hypothetical protein
MKEMDVGGSLLLEVWEVVSDILPNGKREDMARKLIKIFADKGMDQDDFESIKGEDEYLDNVIDSLYTADGNIDYDIEYYDEE